MLRHLEIDGSYSALMDGSVDALLCAEETMPLSDKLERRYIRSTAMCLAVPAAHKKCRHAPSKYPAGGGVFWGLALLGPGPGPGRDDPVAELGGRADCSGSGNIEWFRSGHEQFADDGVRRDSHNLCQ